MHEVDPFVAFQMIPSKVMISRLTDIVVREKTWIGLVYCVVRC